LKFAGDLLDSIKMHICKYGPVNRRLNTIARAVSPKPAFDTVLVIATTQHLMYFDTNFRGTSLMANG
jgi:hypothetical protein